MSRWQVKKDGKPMAGGSITTMPDDNTVRQMASYGYKTYIDGKLYRPKKEAEKCSK
jgi:hypothetical protein